MQGLYWSVSILGYLVYVFIRQNENIDHICLRIMTRTSCLWTAKYIFKYLFEKKGNPFDCFRHFVELPAKTQPLLNYF